MENNLTKPYVYKGIHRVTQQFYIGLRTANRVPAIEDFGKVYRTSSSNSIVHDEFDNFDWEIVKEFDDQVEAYIFEQKMIYENKDNVLILNKLCRYNEEYVPTKAVVGLSGEMHHMYGKTCSESTRKLHSINATGANNHMYGNGHRVSGDKNGKPWLGCKPEDHPMYGKTVSEQVSKQVANANKNRPRASCIYCHKETLAHTLKSLHGPNSTCNSKSCLSEAIKINRGWNEVRF